MLKNYLVTSFRILLRQKSYSAINLFGLTLGITSTLLLILHIVDELSYDKFHPEADRIYRSTFSAKLQGQDVATIQTGVPMAEAMMKDIPSVESTVRITKWNTIPVRYEEKTFTEKNFILADSNFFNFFGYKLLVGNPNEVLKGPHKVVITETTAKKYFGYKGAGDLSPIGKSFYIGSRGETLAEVSGIAADVPHNTHLKFDFVLSLTSWEQLRYAFWLNSSVITYFKIKPKTTIEDVNNKYQYFIENYCAQEIQNFLKMDLKRFTKNGGAIAFHSQPLTSIHLNSQLQDELEPNGNLTYLYMFGLIAGFIILLACINFMNLSTARAANRAKEVGVRKTIGALRSRLMGQFLLESYMYTFLSIVFAIAFVSLSLNAFNGLTGKQIQLSDLFNSTFAIGLFAFLIVIGLLAGSYPAFYLTSFKPVEVLKGKVRAGLKSSGIRNGLVVFQFAISIGLIIATLMVYQQLKFVQQKNLGFNKENVMDLLHTINLGKNASGFKNELLQHPEIIAATFSNRMPPDLDWSSVFRIVDTGEEHLMSIYQVDHDALKTMGYSMASGRFFSRDFPADSMKIIVNETAAKQLGWTTFEGKKIMSRFNSLTEKEYEVIGIIKDFNYQTLKSSIRPMIILLGSEPNYEMGIRLSGNDPINNVKLVESIWKKYAPQAPFEYSFLDDNFNAKFRAEERMGQVFIIFTGLAIVIACLGLFGLATYAAEQRAKEVSIRKVMGASVSQLVLLLTKDFSKLILIAFIIAIPFTWYAVEKWWLESFAYRTSLSATVIILSGLLAMAVAIFTISFQSLKAALVNPSATLKSE